MARIGTGATGWIALTNGVVGRRALCRAVVDADLEGIVCKRLADPHHPQRTSWHKVLTIPAYWQRLGRVEWFSRVRRT